MKLCKPYIKNIYLALYSSLSLSFSLHCMFILFLVIERCQIAKALSCNIIILSSNDPVTFDQRALLIIGTQLLRVFHCFLFVLVLKHYFGK